VTACVSYASATLTATAHGVGEQSRPPDTVTTPAGETLRAPPRPAAPTRSCPLAGSTVMYPPVTAAPAATKGAAGATLEEMSRPVSGSRIDTGEDRATPAARSAGDTASGSYAVVLGKAAVVLSPGTLASLVMTSSASPGVVCGSVAAPAEAVTSTPGAAEGKGAYTGAWLTW